MRDSLEEGGDKMKSFSKERRKFVYLAYTLVCCLVLLKPDFFYATVGNTAGLDLVNALINNFYQMVATAISGLGLVVCLVCIMELGMSWMGHGSGGNQFDALKRMGGGLLWVAAPQLVMLFRVPLK